MKVLVIEDEINITEIIKKYLLNEKFEIISSDNGSDGLKSFFLEKPGFVILDIMLPDMDGFTICQEIRKTSQVPIIILTAKRHITDRLIGLKIGADDYISKPFSPRELIARMHVILRRTQSSTCIEGENKTCIHPNLWHDSKNKQFYLHGKPIDFTKSEYDLLFTLYNNPSKIYSRQELLDIINGDHFSLDRCIDVHIRNIRLKLEDDVKKQNYIKTIFGMGYKYIGRND